jgi:hypothetical protein
MNETVAVMEHIEPPVSDLTALGGLEAIFPAAVFDGEPGAGQDTVVEVPDVVLSGLVIDGTSTIDAPVLPTPSAANRYRRRGGRVASAIRVVALLATATTATVGVAGCSTGIGSSRSATSSVGASAPGFNPAECLSSRNGIRVLDITCVESKGFPAQVPESIQQDEKSIVTVETATYPDPKGEYELGSSTGAVEAPTLVLTAGHDDEDFSSGGCDGALSDVAVPKADGNGAGVNVPLEGLYDSYRTEEYAGKVKGDTDAAIALVGGNATLSLKPLPVETGAIVPAGTPAVALSMQATFGGDNEHNPTSPVASDRSVDVIKLISLGQDTVDPTVTDYLPVGTYTPGQLSAPIEGASGAAIIPVIGKFQYKDVGILVRASVDPYNNPNPDYDALDLYAASSTLITEGGVPPTASDLFPMTQVQRIPSHLGDNFYKC